SDPAVLIVSGIHGNEFETAELFEQSQAEFLIPRTQLLRTHLAAVFMGSRGYDVLVHSEEEERIDLNRQFRFQGDEKRWSDFSSRISYPEAQLLLEALAHNSQSEYLFSFHEDPLRTNNFYIYDGVYKESQDGLYEVIRHLRIELHAQLLAHGYKMLNGPDDAADPYLANIAKNGYIYQPLISHQGIRKTDNTFESAAVELGGKGLINIKRAFTFEIPGKLSRERKAQLIKIIQHHFIIPFLATQGITV
ncbi:MAG: hypothetical protein QG639_1004, partial [Patescibacteria group bacterium]|nr:hypothetical protein [Patescibacteria group bacterium]